MHSQARQVGLKTAAECAEKCENACRGVRIAERGVRHEDMRWQNLNTAQRAVHPYYLLLTKCCFVQDYSSLLIYLWHKRMHPF